MFKMITLALAFGFTLTTGANAALPALEAQQAGSSVIKVGEGCGPNRWRDRFGHCHWFGGPGGTNRGTAYECPPGTHLGPRGGACWPNG